jgi:hypothetical protein
MTTSPDKLLSIARESGAETGAWIDEPTVTWVQFYCLNDLAGFVERIRAEQQDLIDRLRLEAQSHAQEARAQRATVHEIYRLVTGGTGEPGDWNGAEPVRQAFERIRQEEREKVRELLTEAVDFWQTYSSMSEQYQDDMAAERNAMLEKMEDAIRSISTTESKGPTT